MSINLKICTFSYVTGYTGYAYYTHIAHFMYFFIHFLLSCYTSGTHFTQYMHCAHVIHVALIHVVQTCAQDRGYTCLDIGTWLASYDVTASGPGIQRSGMSQLPVSSASRLKGSSSTTQAEHQVCGRCASCRDDVVVVAAAAAHDGDEHAGDDDDVDDSNGDFCTFT